MTKVSYVHDDGSIDELVVDPPTSVMRAAVSAGIAGIVGECGGQAMCATCHVYVRSDVMDELPPMSADEDDMLESTAAPRTDRSRLSCQLHGLGCDELVVEVPARQL